MDEPNEPFPSVLMKQAAALLARGAAPEAGGGRAGGTVGAVAETPVLLPPRPDRAGRDTEWFA